MRLTASRIEMAKRCPGSFTVKHSSTREAFAEDGTKRHAEDEAAIGRGEVPLALTERWPLIEEWRAEVAFAYDVSTGEARELGVGIGRAYEAFNLRPYEVTGTADVVGRSATQLVIVDKKGHEKATAAARNPQVRFLGMAAAVAYERAEVDIAIRQEIGPLDVATIESFDFAVIHDDVKRTLLDVNRAIIDAQAGKPVRFETGRQCRWCDGFDDCPKQRELATTVSNGIVPLRVESMIPFERDEDATAGYELLQQIGILHKRLKASIIARAKERPIPVGDGKVYGFVTKEGDLEIDGDIAYEVIREAHGQEVADKAVAREATQTGIERALKTIAPHGKLAAMKKAVLKAIEERGGSKRPMTTKPDVYPAQPLLKVVG